MGRKRGGGQSPISSRSGRSAVQTSVIHNLPVFSSHSHYTVFLWFETKWVEDIRKCVRCVCDVAREMLRSYFHWSSDCCIRKSYSRAPDANLMVLLIFFFLFLLFFHSRLLHAVYIVTYIHIRYTMCGMYTSSVSVSLLTSRARHTHTYNTLCV